MKNRIRVFIMLLSIVYTFSSCYTVSRVGNCKYYYRPSISSKGKVHQLISF